ITARENIEIRDRIRDAAAKATNAEQVEALSSLLGKFINNWRNMPGPFSEATFADTLSIDEMYELAGLIVRETTLKETDLKNSLWQSRVRAEESAATARAESVPSNTTGTTGT